MAIEKTLSIIKPDAVGKNLIGKIISRFEDNGLCVVAAKLIHLSDDICLLYTSPSPRDLSTSRMPSSA